MRRSNRKKRKQVKECQNLHSFPNLNPLKKRCKKYPTPLDNYNKILIKKTDTIHRKLIE